MAKAFLLKTDEVDPRSGNPPQVLKE